MFVTCGTCTHVSLAQASYVLAPNFNSREDSFFQNVSPRIKLHIFKITQPKNPFLLEQQSIRSTAQRMLITTTPALPHPPALCRRISATWSWIVLLCVWSLDWWFRSHLAPPLGTLGLWPPMSFQPCLCSTSALTLLPGPIHTFSSPPPTPPRAYIFTLASPASNFSQSKKINLNNQPTFTAAWYTDWGSCKENPVYLQKKF